MCSCNFHFRYIMHSCDNMLILFRKLALPYPKTDTKDDQVSKAEIEKNNDNDYIKMYQNFEIIY